MMIEGRGQRIAKKTIAGSFGRAVPSYDEYASLQREVADKLIQGLVLSDARLKVLDIGSGTGYCTEQLRDVYPDADIVSLDLSTRMLCHARDKGLGGPGGYVCGDAEALPFADAVFDIVFSNLTIQWCGDYSGLFHEVSRVARRGAHCSFSTFGPATLHELRTAWSSVDSHVHVNTFAGRNDLEESIKNAGFEESVIDEETMVRYYDDLGDLGRELKAIGAHNMNPGQSRGLTGKGRLRKLRQVFQQGAVQERGVPVTYQVFYLDLLA